LPDAVETDHGGAVIGTEPRVPFVPRRAAACRSVPRCGAVRVADHRPRDDARGVGFGFGTAPIGVASEGIARPGVPREGVGGFHRVVAGVRGVFHANDRPNPTPAPRVVRPIERQEDTGCRWSGGASRPLGGSFPHGTGPPPRDPPPPPGFVSFRFVPPTAHEGNPRASHRIESHRRGMDPGHDGRPRLGRGSHANIVADGGVPRRFVGCVFRTPWMEPVSSVGRRLASVRARKEVPACRSNARFDGNSNPVGTHPFGSVRSVSPEPCLGQGGRCGSRDACRVVSCRVAPYWMDGSCFDSMGSRHTTPPTTEDAPRRDTHDTRRRRPPETAFQGIVDRPPSPFLVRAAHHRSGACLCLASFRVPSVSIRSVHPCRDGTSHRRPTGPSNCNAMQCNAVGMDLGRSAVGFSALGEHVRLEAFCRRSHQGNGSTQQNERPWRDGSTIDERHDTTRHDNRTDPIGAFPNTDLETCSERHNVVVKGGRNPRNTQQKTVMETPGTARHGTME